MGYGPTWSARRRSGTLKTTERASKPPGAIPAGKQTLNPGGRVPPACRDHAGLAEQADAPVSDTGVRKDVGVQVPRSARRGRRRVRIPRRTNGS